MKVDIGDNIVRQSSIDDSPECYRLAWRTAQKCVDENGGFHHLYANIYRVLTPKAGKQFELLTEQIKSLIEQRRAVFEGLEIAE